LLKGYPNLPLQQAVEIIKPDHFMHWNVTTRPLPSGSGVVTNIPFEQQASKVIDYWADYWLLLKGKKKYLAYTQTILMVLTIRDRNTAENRKYVFPHITCNTVTFEDEVRKIQSPPRHLIDSQIKGPGAKKVKKK
jgi:hypothetical protein